MLSWAERLGMPGGVSCGRDSGTPESYVNCHPPLRYLDVVTLSREIAHLRQL